MALLSGQKVAPTKSQPSQVPLSAIMSGPADPIRRTYGALERRRPREKPFSILTACMWRCPTTLRPRLREAALIEKSAAYVSWCQTGLIPPRLPIISLAERIVHVFGHSSAVIVR